MEDYKFFLYMLTVSFSSFNLMKFIQGWDMAFSLLLGVFLQPYPFIRWLSAGIRGVSAWFGPEVGLYTVRFDLFLDLMECF